MPNAGNHPVHVPIAGHTEDIPWARIALYSLLAALAGLALYGAEQAFAQGTDAQDATGPRAFHRGISESLSVASTFASPSAPAHYARTMTESISVQSAFPVQAPQAVAQPRSPTYSAGANQRIDERVDLTFKSLAKRGDSAKAQAGTPYQYELVPVNAAPDSFDDAVEGSGEGSDPDDSSSIIALAVEYGLAQQSLQNAGLVSTGTYGAMVLGSLALAALGRRDSRAFVLRNAQAGRARTPFVAVLALVAAGSVALATDPSAGQAFADTNKAAIVYIEDTTPVYREWIPSSGGGGSWSSTVSLTSADSTLVTAKIEFSPVSSKRVIVTMDNPGRLDSYVCFSGCTDTGNWTHTNNFVDVATTLTTSYRPWDIEYEQTSGDLMIVYDYVESGSSATDDLFYRVMTDSQTSFGSESTINDSGNTATAGLYSFVAMDSQKTSGSDEMALAAVDVTNSDVSAIVWNGSNWTTLPQTELSTAVAIATEEVVDIAYETSSGDILVVAGEGTTVRHNTFSNTSNTWGTSSASTGTWAVGTLNWVKLVADPRSASNAIFLAGVGAGSDLDSAYWSGSAWTDHAEHDGGTGNNADRIFDFAWDGSTSNGVLVWSTATNNLSYTRGDPSSGSFGTDGTFTVDSGGSNQVQWVRLVTNPTAADTVAAIGLESDAQSDIGGIRWDGSTNAPVSTGTDGISTTSTNNSWEPFDVSFQLVPVQRNTSDSVAFTDSIDTTITRNRAINDTLTVGDSPSVNVALTIPVSDTLTVGEAAPRLLDASRAASETLAVADSITFTTLRSVSASDSLSVADAIAMSVSRSVSETLGMTDDAAQSTSAARSVSESLSATDSVVADRLVQVSISDTLSVSDAAARTRLAFVSIADSLAVADSPARTLVTSRAVEDGITISDIAAKRVSRSVSETISLDEGIARGASRSLQDGIAASDSASGSHLTLRSVADALGLQDEISISVSRSVSDAVSITDAAGTRFGPALSDGLGLADEVASQKAFARSLSDSLAVADSAARSLGASRSASDSLAVADSAARSLALSRAVQDALAAADAATGTRAIAESPSDALALADGIAVNLSRGRAVADTLAVADGILMNKSVSQQLSDSLSVADDPTTSHAAMRAVADSLNAADAVERNNFFEAEVSDVLGVSDGAARTPSMVRALQESLAAQDAVERNNFTSTAASDSTAVSDAIQATYLASRSASDAVALADSASRNDFTSVSIADGLVVDDAASPGYFRSIADDIAAGDEIAPPVTGSLRQLSDAVAVDDGFDEVSVQWSRSFEEEMGIGDCTPFACNPMLNFDESLSLGDTFAGPPEIGDSLSVVDSIAAGRSFVPAPEDTLSMQDSSGFAIELAPPAAPEGVPELGAMAATSTEMVGPLPAQAVTGTYSMETGNADDLADQLGLPTMDISAITDWSQLVLVLQTYYVALTPSYLVPADDSMMTVTVVQIPAGTPVLVPVSIENTSETSEHVHIPWMTLEYVPAVDSDNFALLIIPLEQPPDGEPAPSADMVPLYLDVKWMGDFPGAEDPSVASYYAEAPTFTFALTDEWADSQDAERYVNGVPVITLRLLDESTGTWQTISDIDMPSAANDDGQYVYVAHLEHFSTYAITAEEAAVSGGGGGGGRDRFAAGLEESLAVSDSTRVQAVEIIEEPAGVRYSANMQETISIASRPVAYKVLPVREDLDVLISLQQVAQHTGIPPSAKATFEVNINNSGDVPQSFTLKFWYNDDKGVRAFESAQEIAIGARESRQELVEVLFTSPGTFEVTVEARSVEGMLLNTAQMTVEVPWLTVNLWLLVVVALAIIGESAATVLYLLRRRKVAVAVGGQTVVLPRHKTKVSVAAWPSPAKAADVRVSVRIANAGAKRAFSGTQAEVEFEVRNTTDAHQELILACWFDHGPDSWYQRVQLGPHGSDLRRAEVSMPSRGKHILHVEARDTEYGELMGMLRIGALSY